METVPPPVRTSSDGQKTEEDLTWEELCLFSILSDPSGVDQAEFLWYDPAVQDHLVCPTCGALADSVHRWEHEEVDPIVGEGRAPTGCFRVWAFQWDWWHREDSLQIDQSARSVGKTYSIKARGCCFPFVHPGQEMLITAPELVHLLPIVSKIEQQMYATRLYREMLVRGRSGVTHRPFQMNFINGSVIHGRIPQHDGKGVKGQHPIWLEQDEAQDYPEDGWVELNETLQRGVEGASWRAHGVTRGVRDKHFYKFTRNAPDNPWKVHRFVAMWRPNWNDKQRQEAYAKYGSADDPDYRRNILGEHGDATNPIFVYTRLMENVDADELSPYNVSEYYRKKVKIEQLEQQEIDMLQALDFPIGHLSYVGGMAERDRLQDDQQKQKAIYWMGMDVGFTTDPTELLVFVEHHPPKQKNEPHPKDGQTALKLLTRIQMTRMPQPMQIQAIVAALDFYRPRVLAMDKGGVGWGMVSVIQEAMKNISLAHSMPESARDEYLDQVPPWMLNYNLERCLSAIKGYMFGSTVLVGLDETIEYDETERGDEFDQQGVKRKAKEWATDVLRELVDNNRLWLPYDDDILGQYQGATWEHSKTGQDQYGRKIYSKGIDHCLDASRFMALAFSLNTIEERRAAKKNTEPVYDSFLTY